MQSIPSAWSLQYAPQFLIAMGKQNAGNFAAETEQRCGGSRLDGRSRAPEPAENERRCLGQTWAGSPEEQAADD